MCLAWHSVTIVGMLRDFSNAMADAVAGAGPSVVQVQGQRRPASGVVYQNDTVLTTTGALGREDGLRVRRPDGGEVDAELIGWDPASSLALLRANGLDLRVLTPASDPPRVGHLALALARSWSNALTASAGIVSVIGGPLRTGRRRSIAEVLRTTAPMHQGFAGGAFVNVDGHLVGITTASEIRGLGVVIPASIALKTAAAVLEHGRLKRGYLGIAGQPVTLPEGQRQDDEHPTALLVVAVTSGSPAAGAGVLVGDVMLAFDGKPVESPEDLLDLLVGDRVGRTVPLRILRGRDSVDLNVTVGERPEQS
jgi:serine protease DegQ